MSREGGFALWQGTDIKTVGNFLEAADYKDISLYLLSLQEAKLVIEMLGSCQLLRHWETEGDFSLAGSWCL